MVVVLTPANMKLLDKKVQIVLSYGRCDTIQKQIVFIVESVHNINKQFISRLCQETNRMKMFQGINELNEMVNKWLINEVYRNLLNDVRRDGGRIILHKELVEPIRILIVNTRQQLRLLQSYIMTQSRRNAGIKYKIISLNDQTIKDTKTFINRLYKMGLISKIKQVK